MKKLQPLLYVLSSALLLSFAWPGIGNLSSLVFIGFVPLLLLSDYIHQQEKSSVQAFFGFFATFFLWSAATSYWLFCVEGDFWTRFFAGFMPWLINGLWFTVPFMFYHNYKKTLSKTQSLLALPAFWLSMEFIHLHWDFTWPWFSLGNVFANNVSWIQWYEYTGFFGGAIWVWLLNILFYKLLITQNTAQVSKQIRTIVLSLLFPLLVSGICWLAHTEKGEFAELVVVQPNVDPYHDKFNLGYDVQLNSMLALSDSLLSDSTSLLIFPETALQERSNVFFDEFGNMKFAGLWENYISASESVKILQQYLSKHPNLSILSGLSSDSLYLTSKAPSLTARKLGYYDLYYESYNAAIQVEKDTFSLYHKSKLVPGVEALPFAKVVKPILGEAILNFGGASGGLGTQSYRSVFTSVNGKVKVAPVICYESIYGEYVSGYIQNGANLIGIMTNDAWWSNSAGHKQHLAYARLRAIEQRRAVARSANTGVSAFINQRGEILSQSKYLETTALRASVQLNTERTLYSYIGDVLAKVALGISVLLILNRWYQQFLKR